MKVRVGIIGVGNIGSAHASLIYNGEAQGLELCALCDTDKSKLELLKKKFEGVSVFESSDALIRSEKVDAVIISTPHYFHPIIAKEALNNGLHVLSEKPIGVYTHGLDCLVALAEQKNKTFCVMLNQRTNKLFKLAKEFIDGGKIGRIKRSSWIITNWYRTQSYYDSGSWRATWSGEGGGVLMNQAPHNLDLWQWLCGMPKSIYAVCNEGKYHNIEVEDEATLYAEYENGATGVFITTTGDSLGTNRLEIVGTKGKIVLEKGTLTLSELSCDENDYCFGKVDELKVNEQIFHDEEYNGHKNILENFADVILHGKKPISPASEAIAQLQICNAAYLSSWKGERVELPVNGEEYLCMLRAKAEKSHYESKNTENLFSETYNKRWNTNW